MILSMHDVLSAQELDFLRKGAQQLPFVPGVETAGTRAQRVKNNEQVSVRADARKELQKVVVAALERHRDFHRTVLPRHIRPPLISRYREGMAYGKHVDSALMGPQSARERSDVSITVFISDAADYDGGELVIHGSFGAQRVKLPAGAAVAYPSTSLHEVAPVTRGERLVAVTWVQSYVRDERQREILAHLSQVKDKMNALVADAVETDLLHHAHANLLRMWAET